MGERTENNVYVYGLPPATIECHTCPGVWVRLEDSKRKSGGKAVGYWSYPIARLNPDWKPPKGIDNRMWRYECAESHATFQIGPPRKDMATRQLLAFPEKPNP